MFELKKLISILTNNSLQNLIIAIGIFFGILILKKIIIKYIFKTIKKFVKKTENKIDDNLQKAIESPIMNLITFSALYLSVYYLIYNSKYKDLVIVCNKFLKLSLVVCFAWIIYNLTLENSIIYINMKKNKKNKINPIVFPFISIIIRISIIIISIGIVAKEFGFTGFIAGLGISGVVFALAAQDTFSNLLGGMAIVLDKPFSIGDWIQVPEIEGVVENITFRSTRIRTFAKALVTVPNSKLANTNIINWTQREVRRITFTLALSNNTKVNLLKETINDIEKMIKNSKVVSDEIVIVNLNEIKKDGVEVYIYFYTICVDFLEYQKAKEDINLGILDILQKKNIEIARESKDIYIK